MNNKGFTLVEVLCVIVIIGLISGIAVVSYSSHLKTGEEKYFQVIESSIILASNEFFLEHRNALPLGDEVTEVPLGDFVDGAYIEPVRDSHGKICDKGKVYVYKENGQYQYEVCLDCDGYKTEGKYCK